jgi:hypothetical protein
MQQGHLHGGFEVPDRILLGSCACIFKAIVTDCQHMRNKNACASLPLRYACITYFPNDNAHRSWFSSPVHWITPVAMLYNPQDSGELGKAWFTSSSFFRRPREEETATHARGQCKIRGGTAHKRSNTQAGRVKYLGLSGPRRAMETTELEKESVPQNERIVMKRETAWNQWVQR